MDDTLKLDIVALACVTKSMNITGLYQLKIADSGCVCALEEITISMAQFIHTKAHV